MCSVYHVLNLVYNKTLFGILPFVYHFACNKTVIFFQCGCKSSTVNFTINVVKNVRIQIFIIVELDIQVHSLAKVQMEQMLSFAPKCESGVKCIKFANSNSIHN